MTISLTAASASPFRSRRLAGAAILLSLALGAAGAARAQDSSTQPPSGPALVKASDQVAGTMNGRLTAKTIPAGSQVYQSNVPGEKVVVPPAPAAKAVGSGGMPSLGTPQLVADPNNEIPVTKNAPPPAGDDVTQPPADANAPAAPSTAGVQTTAQTTDALESALAAEAARAAQVEAESNAQKAQAEQKMNERAYNSAVKGLFPMSTDQIKGVMKKMEDTQNASVPPSYGQPSPQVAVQTISLDPGVAPPEIAVAVGYVTTLTMLDATGQPWPIIDIGVGGNFDIPAPEANSHIVRITPMTRYGYGNLSVRLKDLPTPITFRLSSGGDVVHYRYDARIPRNGPNAKVSLIEKQKLTAGDDVIMAVLDNSIPAGAKKLKVDGTDRRTQAYKVGDRTFVRTPLSMISPSWDASVASADGMTVYEVGDTPVVLLSDNGNLVRVRLSEQAVQ